MKKTYPAKNGPASARVHVTIPNRFFGQWRVRLVWPGERDLHNSLIMKCGSDGRLKVHWKKNQGEGVMVNFAGAVNQAVADITGGVRNVCELGGRRKAPRKGETRGQRATKRKKPEKKLTAARKAKAKAPGGRRQTASAARILKKYGG